MSDETSVKFLIPESSCQRDFEVWSLFANETKESVLRCDWVDKYHCDSALGYTYTLENGTAVITLPRDLEKKPDHFICESLFRPKTDPSRCLCRIEAIIIPGQPDSHSPGQAALIAGLLSAGLVLLFVILVVVGILTYIRYRRRTSSKSKHDSNVRTGEFEPLRMDLPQISVTDSKKFLKQTLTAPSSRTVPRRKKAMLVRTQLPLTELYNRRRESI